MPTATKSDDMVPGQAMRKVPTPTAALTTPPAGPSSSANAGDGGGVGDGRGEGRGRGGGRDGGITGVYPSTPGRRRAVSSSEGPSGRIGKTNGAGRKG